MHFLLSCKRDASCIEAITAKMPPTLFLDELATTHGQQASSDFAFAWCKLTSLLGTLLRLVGLVEEEVGGQLLVLVAGEVGLDDQVTLEAETAKL
jgi:hypothetical protein